MRFHKLHDPLFKSVDLVIELNLSFVEFVLNREIVKN